MKLPKFFFFVFIKILSEQIIKLQIVTSFVYLLNTSFISQSTLPEAKALFESVWAICSEHSDTNSNICLILEPVNAGDKVAKFHNFNKMSIDFTNQKMNSPLISRHLAPLSWKRLLPNKISTVSSMKLRWSSKWSKSLITICLIVSGSRTYMICFPNSNVPIILCGWTTKWIFN